MTKNYKIKSAKEIKIASSGTRLLELFKALVKKPLTPNELLKVVEESSDDIYRPEVVTKYINTLRLLGFEIVKIKDKYHLLKAIDSVDYSEMDLSTLKFLEKYLSDISIPTFQENFSEILQLIEKSFSYSTKKYIEDHNIVAYLPKKSIRKENKDASQYEKYCKEGLKLSIVYESCKNQQDEYTILPLEILYKNGTIVLVAYDCRNCTYKEFVINFIKDIKQLPQKQSGNYSMTVTFKLKNRLAKSYLLKPNEKIIEFGKDFIIVSNQKEDRNLLIRRLARYFNQCEVLYPQEFRKQMVEYIEAIEKIYEKQN